MDYVISKIQFFLSTFFFPIFVIDQNRLPTCSNFTQPTPAAAMFSFNAFDQFHPAMTPQCNSNNYPWSHYCCTVVFIHTMHCWKRCWLRSWSWSWQKLIAISSWWKQDIHLDFKSYASLKRGLIILVIFQWSQYWADKGTVKCPCSTTV